MFDMRVAIGEMIEPSAFFFLPLLRASLTTCIREGENDVIVLRLPEGLRTDPITELL